MRVYKPEHGGLKDEKGEWNHEFRAVTAKDSDHNGQPCVSEWNPKRRFVSAKAKKIGFYTRKAVHVSKFFLAGVRMKPVALDVSLHVTYRCNQDCAYCDRHINAGKKDSLDKEELSADQIYRIARDFIKLGARGFLLDGGEVLLRADLEPLLRYFHSERVEVRLNTNGTLLPYRSSWLPYFDKIKISIDGPREVHDRFRGKGTFERAMQGFETAKRAGVKVEFTCVVHSENVFRIPEILDLAGKLGTRVFLQPARSSLFVSKKRSEPSFSAERGVFSHMINQLIRRSGHPGLGNTKASLRHFLNFPEPTKIACSAGWVGCSVDPYGRLSSCPMLPPKPSDPDLLSMNVEEAFAKLSRTGCRNCWCARQVELNFLWAGEFHRFL